MKMEDKQMIFEEVKKFVEEACIRNDKGYAKEWLLHLNSVAKNAVELAEKLNADKEVVEIAAWFHDIGVIMHGKENHHITGAEIAENKLFGWGCPKDKIEKVKHCILAHRASQNIPRETIEARILADADSMAHFDEVKNLVKAALILGGASNEEKANQRVKEKLIRSWNRLSPEGKKFVEIKYPGVLRETK